MTPRAPKDRIVWVLSRVLVERGMSAYALAERVTGISDSTVYRAAKAEASAARATGKTLCALCRALDCQPGDLLEYRKR